MRHYCVPRACEPRPWFLERIVLAKALVLECTRVSQDREGVE